LLELMLAGEQSPAAQKVIAALRNGIRRNCRCLKIKQPNAPKEFVQAGVDYALGITRSRTPGTGGTAEPMAEATRN
jgi:hypothetical protein